MFEAIFTVYNVVSVLLAGTGILLLLSAKKKN